MSWGSSSSRLFSAEGIKPCNYSFVQVACLLFRCSEKRMALKLIPASVGKLVMSLLLSVSCSLKMKFVTQGSVPQFITFPLPKQFPLSTPSCTKLP